MSQRRPSLALWCPPDGTLAKQLPKAPAVRGCLSSVGSGACFGSCRMLEYRWNFQHSHDLLTEDGHVDSNDKTRSRKRGSTLVTVTTSSAFVLPSMMRSYINSRHSFSHTPFSSSHDSPALRRCIQSIVLNLDWSQDIPAKATMPKHRTGVLSNTCQHPVIGCRVHASSSKFDMGTAVCSIVALTD